jgi:uncharacterized protein
MIASLTIVIIGRSNKAKRSESILKIAQNFRDQGCSIHEFESDRQQAARRINHRIARFWPALMKGDRGDFPPHRRLMLSLIRTILALATESRWVLGAAMGMLSERAMLSREINRFINRLPYGQVHVIGHSAGAILATRVSKNAKISTIICFGYPFQHPEHPPEAYRTAHLASVAKPLLFLQGTSDIYGSDPCTIARLLPAGARLVMLDCDHNYGQLPSAEFNRAWSAVSQFIGGSPAGDDAVPKSGALQERNPIFSEISMVAADGFEPPTKGL